MKVIEKQEVIKKVEYYEAVDGKRFYGERAKEECEKYEQTANCIITARYNECVIRRICSYHIIPMCCDDNDFDIVKIENENDLKAVNMYIKMCIDNGYNKPCTDDELLSKNTIGTVQLLSWNYEHDYVNILGTINDLVNTIRNNYNNNLVQE